MPAGISDPTTGFAVFAGIKLVGYCGAAHFLVKSYPEVRSSTLLVGVARTAVGLLIGIPYGMVSLTIFQGLGMWAIALLYLGLVPVRYFEWWLVISYFFERKQKNPKLKTYIILGIFWSFLLDLPAVFGLLKTAGFWIC